MIGIVIGILAALGGVNKDLPAGFELAGSAKWGYGGYRDEVADYGAALDSYGSASGSVSDTVLLDSTKGRWVTFRFRGRAEDAFAVQNDQLFMQIDFYSQRGTHYLDTAKRLIYREILRDRKDLASNANDHKSAGVWRTYEFEELLPFREADSVKVSIGFKGGTGTDKTYSRFIATDLSVVQRADSTTGKVDPGKTPRLEKSAPLTTAGMISLGGRWFYKPNPNETLTGHLVVTEANSDRLFYDDGRLENPFYGNMTAWLRKGFKDLNGEIAQTDSFVPDNVVLEFNGDGWIVVKTRNLPNHPTARFPDTFGSQGYNPSYIQAHNHTYRLPVSPSRNPGARVMAHDNSNWGLPMGSVGFAVNGVAFYNPFDANMTDASGIMDRCCGHPSPDNRYHYHKYPICVNTPFVDKGEAHSPLIGFAFDGFPIYGPYEASGVMAEDLTNNKLDGFNAHFDPARGWHYHVTPGKFPYVLGGFMGKPVSSDLDMPWN